MRNVVGIKRIYEPPAKTDGYRVLVDRLWPRGLSKERVAIDEWFKDIAPSPELRVWFGHKPERFSEFSHRYISELAKNPVSTKFLRVLAAHKTVTLLYGAKDQTINHAVVLLDFYKAKLQDQ